MSIPHVAYPRHAPGERFRSPRHVYAAQDPSGGPIKVGVSAFPVLRAQNIFADRKAEKHPVMLAVFFSAGPYQERDLHKIIAPWSTGESEMYEDCPAVLTALKAYGLAHGYFKTRGSLFGADREKVA